MVDDYIPVRKGTLQPKFSNHHGNEMWVMLMEKAFAKMYGGYDRLEGGQMSWALSALTGNPSVSFARDGKTWHALGSAGCRSWHVGEPLSDDAMWDLLRKSHRNAAFMCCAGIGQSTVTTIGKSQKT